MSSLTDGHPTWQQWFCDKVKCLQRSDREALHGTAALSAIEAVGLGRPAIESARVGVKLASIGPDVPTGTFQEDGDELDW